MRKIIQIAASSAWNAKTAEMFTTLVSLADDGTVFVMKSGESEWKEVPVVPQKDEVKT